MGDIAVGEDDLVDGLVPDELLQVRLGHDGDPLGIAGAGQLRGVAPTGDPGDLRGREGDDAGLGMLPVADVEDVEVAPRGAHDHGPSDRHRRHHPCRPWRRDQTALPGRPTVPAAAGPDKWRSARPGGPSVVAVAPPKRVQATYARRDAAMSFAGGQRMYVPDLGALLQESQSRRLALEATGVYFISEIDPPHAEDLFRSLLLMALSRKGERDQPITLFINSGGGSLGDGLAMMEFIYRMRRDHAVRIDTAVLGYAYSMGAVVLQAGDHRTIGRFGTLMLHSTSWIISGDDERIFKDFQRLATHYQETVAQLFAARTGHRDAGWWRRFIWSGRDRFLGPQECLDLGLVDEIVDPVLADGTALHVPTVPTSQADDGGAKAPEPEDADRGPTEQG